MYCFKEHGFFSEGFDPDEIAYDASHRAGNRKTGSQITTPAYNLLGQAFWDLRYATRNCAALRMAI